MSFTQKVKNEIIEKGYYKGKHKLAFAYGLFLFGKEFNENEISFITENYDIATVYHNLLYDLFELGGTATITKLNNNRSKALYSVVVDAHEDRVKIVNHYRAFSIENSEYIFNNRTAFMSGLFLACANIVNPSKSYHLEFGSFTDDRAQILSDFFKEFGIKHGTTHRRNSKIIYIKESEQIEDVLTMAGATNATFEFMDVKIYKEIRNKVNRRINCETANIEKTVNASSTQVRAIKMIKARMDFSELEESLREVAQIRLDNPEISLREIGELTEKPLSRSAVNHRMQKILAIAQELEN